jgi:hypothetical protein
MRDHLVSYLRLLGFSVCTLAVALCTRFGPAHAATPAPEPRFSLPPTQGDIAAVEVAQSEEQAIADLDARLTAVSDEITNLTKALDVLGPLPDHPDLFIPVAMSELENPATGGMTVRPYSPVASPASRFGDRLVSLGAMAAPTRSANIGRLQAGYDIPAHNVRFNPDLSADATIAALCVELSAVSGPPLGLAPIRAW